MPRRPERLLVSQAQRLRISDLTRAGVFRHPRQVHFVRLEPTGLPFDIPLLACTAVPFFLERFRLAMAHHTYYYDPSQSVRYWLYIESTPCRLGGKRYWFTCPSPDCPRAVREPGGLVPLGEEAPHWRMTTLYLPPRALAFRCMQCHHLVYPTQRLHYPAWPRRSSHPEPTQPTSPSPRDAITNVLVARARWRRCLEAATRVGHLPEDAMSTQTPSPTLRQQAVWYLWAMRRVRVEELAGLFGVSPRTIKRDLAALRARGWRRPRLRDTFTDLAFNLIATARGGLEEAIRMGCEQYKAEWEDRASRATWSTKLLELHRQQGQLATVAAELAQATLAARGEAGEKESQLMEQELAAELATMVRD